MRALRIVRSFVTAAVPRLGSTAKMTHDHLDCPLPFPPAIIGHAVWLYVRFTLSYRDVKDPFAECGLDGKRPGGPRG